MRRKTVFAALIAATVLSACDSDDGYYVPIQVIHAVADAPSVDVMDGALSLYSDVAFKQATGFDSFPVYSGTARISVDANLPDGPLTVVPVTDLALNEGTEYSIIALGSVSSAATPIQPLVIGNPTTPVTAGNVRLQVVHGAAGAPPVDIHVTGPNDPIVPANAIAGGSTPFGANSDRIEVPAGDYRVRVTLPDETTPVFDSGTVALPEGADLLVVAVDNTVAGRTAPGAPPITLLVADGESQFEILDQATPADIRIVHAVPDVNGVDIYVDDPTAAGSPAIGDLDYTEIVPADGDSYLSLPAGTVNVLVTAAGNPGVIGIPASDLELAAGQQYTVFASGTLAGGITPYITEDNDRSVATEAQARIIHLAPSAGLVDIYVTAPMTDIAGVDPTFSSVDFGANTGYVSLGAGTYDVTVTLAGTLTAAIGPATITLDAGGVYTAVARDPDPDIANDSFGLILLDDF
jgi:Domain of unknown function (DUF4397)